MSTWKTPAPKPNGYLCDSFFHLRKSGNLLALYCLLAKLTKGGTTTFFGTYANVARYFFPNANGEKFGAAYETVRRNFHALRKLGWLKARPDGDWDFIDHKEWAKEHAGECLKRVVIPWQDETDPLVKQLYALSGGKLRLMENHIAGMRKLGTDQEIIEAFATKMKEAEERRAVGKYEGTSVRSVFGQAFRSLQAQKRAVENPTPKLG